MRDVVASWHVSLRIQIVKHRLTGKRHRCETTSRIRFAATTAAVRAVVFPGRRTGKAVFGNLKEAQVDAQHLQEKGNAAETTSGETNLSRETGRVSETIGRSTKPPLLVEGVEGFFFVLVNVEDLIQLHQLEHFCHIGTNVA